MRAVLLKSAAAVLLTAGVALPARMAVAGSSQDPGQWSIADVCLLLKDPAVRNLPDYPFLNIPIPPEIIQICADNGVFIDPSGHDGHGDDEDSGDHPSTTEGETSSTDDEDSSTTDEHHTTTTEHHTTTTEHHTSSTEHEDSTTIAPTTTVEVTTTAAEHEDTTTTVAPTTTVEVTTTAAPTTTVGDDDSTTTTVGDDDTTTTTSTSTTVEGTTTVAETTTTVAETTTTVAPTTTLDPSVSVDVEPTVKGRVVDPNVAGSGTTALPRTGGEMWPLLSLACLVSGIGLLLIATRRRFTS